MHPPHSALRVTSAPDYDRGSVVRRLWSWLRFFAFALWHVGKTDRRHMLFIVSNPPFLPLLGWLAAVLRGQPYCVLVYDLYPGVLVRMGRISANGPAAWLWGAFNRLVWARATVVFTIGEYMAANIRAGARNAENLCLRVIPNWADVDFVKPLAPTDNPFRQLLGWAGRTVVLYSGNLGDAHNLDGLLMAAEQLRARTDLGFLIIGAGPRWNATRETIARRGLDNVRLLPFQPEALLAQTLPAGDIAVVSMATAVAGYLVPSKTYYALAAGSALLALVPPDCEVADLVERNGCGLRVDPEDAAGIVAAIQRLLSEPLLLQGCRRRAREVAVRQYSRTNTRYYVEALRPWFGSAK